MVHLLQALPEAQLLQALGFCASVAPLCALAAASRFARSLAFADSLWAIVWRNCVGPIAPGDGLRARLASHVASRCTECGTPTPFEHVILGCRLCQQCERSCARYALVRAGTAAAESQLPREALQALRYFSSVSGRVYLRCEVEELVASHHSREGLRHLRAKNDVGIAASGRQRAPKQGRKGGASARDGAGGRKRDADPCCFEATALRLAEDSFAQVVRVPVRPASPS